jgi:ABC-type lipoprotein release transport system permease subunit
MGNPLSLGRFYLRNKRKVLPVIGILALAILGVVVTDSLLASARETAYVTFGSYQKLILVAPRPTRDQDLAQPLQEAMNSLKQVQSQVDSLDGPNGLASYYNTLAGLPDQLRAQVPVVAQLQRDAENARYYAARLRGDLAPLGQLITRVQRVEAEEQALIQLQQQLFRNPRDLRPLVTYLQQHQTWLSSVLPSAIELNQLQQAVNGASADTQGLQQALSSLAGNAGALQTAGRNIPELPQLPSAGDALAPFRSALDSLKQTLASFDAPPTELDEILTASQKMPEVDFARRDAYANLNINLLAGNAQFDLYGLDQSGMKQLLALYSDYIKEGRLPRADANEVVISQEIARGKNVSLGGQVGNDIDELDRLPDTFKVVGIVAGPTRIGLIPFEYMTEHYFFERRYEGLIVAPHPGHELQVHHELEKLVAGKAYRLYDWPYIKGKIDSLIANLDTINRFLILLVTIVLSLVVGLLNNLFFKQRMNEFGLLAAIGYSRWALVARVAWESFWVVIVSWILGVTLGVTILSWFNQTFMVPHGLLMTVFNWNVLISHTLPVPLMVFVFGMGTVAWQLLRLDPISIIERRD